MSEVLASGRPQNRAKVLFNQRKHAEAKEVIRLAVRALGTEARLMPLRGVLLGATGLVDPSSRPIHDVDVLLDGISLGSGIARLARAGFRIERTKRTDENISLSHPYHESLWLDVQRAPVPRWLGRITSAYLYADAKIDSSLFGVPVTVPSRPRLLVHLVAHILKDRVIGAFRHAATDLAAAAAACTTAELDDVSNHLHRLSLLDEGILAVLWAQALTCSPVLEDLAHRMEPEAQMRALHWEKVMALQQDEPQARSLSSLGRASALLQPTIAQRLRRGIGRHAWSARRGWIAVRWWVAAAHQ